MTFHSPAKLVTNQFEDHHWLVCYTVREGVLRPRILMRNLGRKGGKDWSSTLLICRHLIDWPLFDKPGTRPRGLCERTGKLLGDEGWEKEDDRESFCIHVNQLPISDQQTFKMNRDSSLWITKAPWESGKARRWWSNSPEQLIRDWFINPWSRNQSDGKEDQSIIVQLGYSQCIYFLIVWDPICAIYWSQQWIGPIGAISVSRYIGYNQVVQWSVDLLLRWIGFMVKGWWVGPWWVV